jgi:branched-chain amino acid transport system permease protein
MTGRLRSMSLTTRGDVLGFAIVLILLFTAGLVVTDPTILSLVTIALVWLSVNSAWNFVLGYAGVFSFGQIAFFAVGAYSAGIAASHIGFGPVVSTLTGALGGALAAFVIGVATLRLRGVYVALVTLAFHELLRTLISTDYSTLTGGPNGLSVPRYMPGAPLLVQARVDYFVAWSVLALTGCMLLILLRSPFGLALIALRDAEHVASARGVSRRRYQVSAFVLSGGIAGLSGGFYAHYVGVVAPTIISFALVMNLFAMIVVGGLGTFWGPVFGTALITAATTYLQGISPQYQSLIVAFLLLAMILFLPKGIVGLAIRVVRPAASGRVEPA